MRRLLLVALLGIAVTPLACGKRGKDTPAPGSAGAPANTVGDVDAEGDPAEGSTLPADKLDVCSQLTKEEVEAALGRPVLEPRRGTELSSRRSGTLTSSCMFGGNEGFVSLHVKRRAPGSTTSWDAAKYYEELKDRIVKAQGGEAEIRVAEVSGIGADAFAETKEETVAFETTELRVLSKRSILTVRVVGLLAATSSLEAAKILAAKALPRLEEYERAGIIPEPGANPGDDKSQRMPESERKTTKEAEQSPARDNTKASSRRADEASSKQGKKSVKEPAKKTPDRTKREAAKTAGAKPKSKKRT